MQPSKKREKEVTQLHSDRLVEGGSSRKIPSYWKGTASSNQRSRSQSFDRHNNNPSANQQHAQTPNNTPSRSASLDPTGMFRNRGRRVISKPSSPAKAANNNHLVITADYSSALPITTSSPQNKNVDGNDLDQQMVEEYDEKERNTEVVQDGHQNNDNIETNSAAVDATIQTHFSSDCIQQSPAVMDSPAKECRANISSDEKKSADNIIEQVVNIDQISDERDDSIMIRERDNSNNNDSATCDESAEFVPSITLETLKRFEFQSSNATQQSLHNRDGKIQQTFSNDSNDSEQYCHSGIGSTTSVMGSLVGENEGTTIGCSFEYDKSKFNAVKRRMMQDVEEIAEMDENLDCDDDDDDDDDDYPDDEGDKPTLTRSALHALSDTVENSVNESMECNGEEASREEVHEYESKTDEIVNLPDNNGVQTDEAIKEDTIESSGDEKGHNTNTASHTFDESPLRAAFRRKTQSVTNSLRPLPSHLSALTPNRFHSSYAKTENAVASGLKVAQQCFSFEDTTVDDSNFLIMDSGGDGAVKESSHKFYGLSGVASFVSEDDAERNASKRNLTMGNDSSDVSFKKSTPKKGATRPKWYPPMSGGGKLLSPKVIRHRQNSPIRPSVSDGIRLSSSFDPESLSSRNTKMETHLNKAMILLRSVVQESSSSEKDGTELKGQWVLCESCQLHNGNKSDEMPSIRHDNCPSCLEKMKSIVDSIKRGISAESGNDSDDNDIQPKFDNEVQCAAIDLLFDSHQYALQMKLSTLLAKTWLESTEPESIEVASTSNETADEYRVMAERTILRQQEEISRLNSELSKCRTEIGRLKCSSREHEIPALTINKSILSDSSSDHSADGNNSLNLTTPIPTVKYYDSHDESFIRFEKRIEADMNLECRKEIIFLKAALEKANRKIGALERDTMTCHEEEEPFKSEIEAIHASNTTEGTEDMIIQIAKSIENESVGSSSLADDDDDEEEEAQSNDHYSISLADPKLEKELEEYRSALIESLRMEESSKNMGDPIDAAAASSVVEKDDVTNNMSSESSSDKRTINVRMIDGENFTTEWSDLVEPLPPPPDHGLKSPIVDTILSKWTDDPGTRSALIQWIENILNGTSCGDSPSLKLSGLDHQIRDGFIMHVLPLLLLRKDIHVHVTSRAHRQTTYDMAVSISQSVRGSTEVSSYDSEGQTLGESIHRSKPVGRKHQMMAYQAAHSGSATNKSVMKDSNVPHFSARQFLGRSAPDIVRTASHTESISTAVTAQISNRTPQAAKSLFRSKAEGSYTAHSEMKTPNRMSTMPPQALGDDLSMGSSASEDDGKSHNQSSSIMGSISGAFGGLLSRRKGPQPPDLYHPLSSDKSPSIHSSSWSSPAFFTPQPNRNQNELRHDDIYHRVVSAPPGKIGLTFVEYEGNTMVSNVSDSSPLSGWVFPSDVLVAIDDTPVRDLRTREIVQILTEKKDQQRNLRMYSLNRR